MSVTNKDLLKQNINRDIEDNEFGKVSPEDIRKNMIDLVDSVHVLSDGLVFIAGNFTTPENNTFVGLDRPQNNEGDNNTSVGYSALRSNRGGNDNTAIGTSSLSCNVYGSGNSTLGFSALAGNYRGDNNVALGKYALYYNKNGNFNIAIGHGAGYYIGENDSYKFYLGSHDVDHSGLCNHPDGLPDTSPLMHGDLLDNRLAINSNELHSEAQLQVNGSIAPSNADQEDDLGSYNYPWNKAYINNLDGSGEDISVWRNLLPYQPSIFNLGSEEKPWNHLYVDNLHVNSLADIVHLNYVTIDESQFYDKRIYLASSGVDSNNNAKPYLTDEGIDGGGLIIESSGVDYRRTYEWTYKAPDLDIACPETSNAYSRSAWYSNISVEIENGRHLQTQRILSDDRLTLISRNCFGLHIDEAIVIGNESERFDYASDSYQADFMRYSSGDYSDFYTTSTSGTIEQGFFTQYDGSSDLNGFKQSFIDDESPRFVLTSYLNGENSGAFVTTQSGNYFGFSDDPHFVPQTILNVKSDDTIVRYSSSNPKIQLGDSSNDFNHGIELEYTGSKFNINRRDGGDTSTSVTLSGDAFGINKSNPHESLVVGKNEHHNAVLSLEETSGIMSDRLNFGGLFVKSIVHPDINHSLFFRADNGQEFDLLLSSGDKTQPEYVYYDGWANTFVGFESIEDRVAQTNGGNLERNTTVGHRALRNLQNGDDNLAIGAFAGSGMRFGNRNIFLGSRAGLTDDDQGQTINNQIRVGHDDDHLLVSGELPYTGNRGYAYFQSEVGVVSSDNKHQFSMSQYGPNSVFSKQSSGDITFRFHQDTDIEPLVITESGIKTYRIEFPDESFLDTASDLKYSPGEAISFVDESGTDRRLINLDIEGLPYHSGLDWSTYFPVDISGDQYKSSVLSLVQFLNPTTPNLFFPCGGGYNILVSNNSDVDSNKNCNNFVAGNKAGNYMKGFTNGVIIGTKAGEEAQMDNDDLSIDTAPIFIGKNAGRQSSNADNSIFIGPSAGQNSKNSDNSIFIGNSAGQSTESSKSIGIGDDVLQKNVKGENNLEIVADHRINNRLINGEVSDKLNIGGIIAGDVCCGRVSVGGAARIFPNAVLEVNSKHGDNETHLQEWYNGQGDLVAYLDQGGNLVLKGTIVQSSSYLGGANTTPAAECDAVECGNNNIAGNTAPTNTNTGNNGGDNNGGNNNGGGNNPTTPPEGYLLPYTVLYEEL